MKRLCAVVLVIAALIGASAQLSFAQQRMNDKDVEATMKNLKEDAKKYRKTFDDALKKSSIRNTSQEKEAKTLAQQFEKQTDGMLNQFKKTQKADDSLKAVMYTADRLERTADSAGVRAQVSASWTPVRSTLDRLAAEFNFGTSQP